MRDDTHPQCPHPYGTREADGWWDLYFKFRVEAMRRDGVYETWQQRAAESVTYGHDFDNPNGQCTCGTWHYEYALPTDDDRWRRRAEFTCRYARERAERRARETEEANRRRWTGEDVREARERASGG